MSWNLVLNKFIEIKNEYKRKLGYITLFNKKSETCLERWVKELNGIEPFNQYTEYEDILSCLELNQHDNMLLIRYGRYSNIYDGEKESSPGGLWDRYSGFYRECRSIVIDVENDCIILSPFKKFFNINETEETNIENVSKLINNAKVVEFSDKLDGSMQSARWYNNKIIMAGSQAINPDNSWRLTDGYKMINMLPQYKDMLIKYPECTFIFEYISLKDAHVVKYTKEQEGLYLIGIRNALNGIEFNYKEVLNIANSFNIPTTKIFDKKIEQVMSELDSKLSNEAEGFVINIDGYRVKIKYNDYVHIHKALSKLSSINLIIRNIADDTYDDLISKLPLAYHEQVKNIASIVVEYINKTEKEIEHYFSITPKDNKKEFMIFVTKNIPREYQAYVRELYLGNPINVIKGGNKKCPNYKKLKDMGVSNYLEIFREEEEDV